jgi:hypothetical protein
MYGHEKNLLINLTYKLSKIIGLLMLPVNLLVNLLVNLPADLRAKLSGSTSDVFPVFPANSGGFTRYRDKQRLYIQ